MDNAPAVALLKATHDFPCPYVFKIIARSEAGFVPAVVAVVQDELACESIVPCSWRESSGGRHISVTVQPRMENAEQVLAIYGRLLRLPGVLFLF